MAPLKLTLEETVKKIGDENPEKVTQMKVNPKLGRWLVGQTMKETDGWFREDEVIEAVRVYLGFGGGLFDDI